MDIKERYRLIAVSSFFIGLLILFCIGFAIIIVYSHYNPSYVLPNPYFYLYLELFFLTLAGFFSSYFRVRSVKSLKVREIHAIRVIFFGEVVIACPLIGIGLLFSGLLYFIIEGFLIFFVIGLIPFLVALIPGALLFVHGWDLRKNLKKFNLKIAN